jgi:2-aminobenzoate-CoA ligase
MTRGRTREASAHRDDFARRNLPPPEQWPTLLQGQPSFQYPDRLNCAVELLDRAVNEKGWGDRVAMRGPYGEITYRRLLVMANRIAHVLIDDLGLISGNRVLLHSRNHAMMAACWLAIQKAGGIAIATMPLLHARELREIVDCAQISHVLCDEALAAEVRLTQPHCPTLRHIEYLHATPLGAGLGARMHKKSDHFDNVDTAADDIAMIAFSSGSTGAPKGTMHFHRDVLAICDAFPQSILKPVPDDIFCGSSPLGFTYGLGGLLLFPLRHGASTVLLEKASPDILLQTIQDYRATVCFTVPTVYRQMLPHVTEFDLSTLRKCVSAGEPLPETTRESWRRATGIRLIDGLGSTEMLHIFISAANDDIRRGAMGRPIPGYEAIILDDEGNPLPNGKTGRLAVRGPTGCRYLADARQKDYVVNGWNVTGDAAEMDSDGYVFHHGRTDDLIITSGQNVNGVEVEEVLMSHPAVAECAVIGIADAERGQLVKAFVVLNQGHEESIELTRQLQEHVRHSLAQYKYPRLVEFRRTLPRTESGKLQRFRLKTEGAGVEYGRRQNLQSLQPEGWARPRGFSNGIKATGTYISIAGQVGWDAQRRFVSDDFVEQARQALQNVVDVVAVAGGRASSVVRLTWYVTDKKEYLAQSKALGLAYRSVMGRHYPAMTVVQVAALIEDAAKVEIEATAVLQD